MYSNVDPLKSSSPDPWLCGPNKKSKLKKLKIYTYCNLIDKDKPFLSKIQNELHKDIC